MHFRAEIYRLLGLWGKVKKEVVSTLKLFALKEYKIAALKTSFLRIFLLHLFTPFKRLFAPTFRRPFSKLCRYLESLGKINKKKWSQIVKLLLIKGVNSPRKKKFFFPRLILPCQQYFFGIGAPIRIGLQMFCLPYEGFLYLYVSLMQVLFETTNENNISIIFPPIL